jgi:hypothetical protein
VKACQVLEQLGDEAVSLASVGTPMAPGFVIQIVNAPSRASLLPSAPPTIDAEPAHEPVRVNEDSVVSRVRSAADLSAPASRRPRGRG